jgi:transposase
MPVGDDTLCTLMRQTPLPTSPAPRILGVDDWAIRKGQTYATILVDLETGRPIDLLSERSAGQFAQWLKDHPGMTIISRDRGTIYAEGATTGAPDALHVADRWHILKNLGDALVRVFEQHHHALTTTFATVTRTVGGPDSTGVAESAAEPMPKPRTRRIQEQQTRHAAKCARQAQVQQLHAEGCSLRAIAAQTGLERKTVRKYLQLPMMPPPQARGQRKSLLDPYKAYLVERWNAGCGNAMQLLSEIQRQGFQGQRSTVRAFVTQLRKDQGLAPRSQPKPHDVTLMPARKPPTLRTLTWLVIRHPATLHADQQSDIDVARQAHPAIATAITLAQEFAMLVRRRAADGLNDWLDRATTSGSMPFRNFAKSLRQDEAAIRAALTLRWSNGPVEGHINRLKLLKRQAYGRAKLDLLRVRLLTG